MEFYDFPYIGNFIIPTDELIFFRGLKPPTRRVFLWDELTPRTEVIYHEIIPFITVQNTLVDWLIWRVSSIMELLYDVDGLI